MRMRILLTLFAVASSQRMPIPVVEDDAGAPIHSGDRVQMINTANVSWSAWNNPAFHGKTWEYGRRLCGLLPPIPAERFPEQPAQDWGVPDSYDTRDAHPECVHEIRNQRKCGSCWAFATTEVLSDRMCIQGGPDTILSVQDPISCDENELGCSGGSLYYAWKYLATTGVVADICLPYHSGEAGERGECPRPRTCEDGKKPAVFWADESSYARFGSVLAIQQAILADGPVSAGFTAYEDIYDYKDGVYSHVTGKKVGGHAIKIVGWGTWTDGTPYWTVANSWGPEWGRDGYFLFKRGNNEVGIEGDVCAAQYSRHNGTAPTTSTSTGEGTGTTSGHNIPIDPNEWNITLDGLDTIAAYILYGCALLVGLLCTFSGRRYFKLYTGMLGIAIGASITYLCLSEYTSLSQAVQIIITLVVSLLVSALAERTLYLALFNMGASEAFVISSLTLYLARDVVGEPFRVTVIVILSVSLGMIAVALGQKRARGVIPGTAFTSAYAVVAAVDYFVLVLDIAPDYGGKAGYFLASLWQVPEALHWMKPDDDDTSLSPDQEDGSLVAWMVGYGALTIAGCFVQHFMCSTRDQRKGRSMSDPLSGSFDQRGYRTIQ